MRAISLFSGCGGFEVGFDMAGIETVLQAESDPWCLSVLARHWPDVRRVDDVRSVTNASCAGFGGRETGQNSVDLIYGGFPCQDVSVAGKRAGLSGERSGLWSEFQRVLSELRPRWTVIENVPGLLSSNRGLDFLRILVDLDDLRYGVAWRVVDARWFGVAQRRRRVFIVGCAGDAARAAQVLAVCESCGGHSTKSGEAGERVAATLSGGAHGAGVNLPGRHHEDDENLVIARGLTSRNERIDAETENLVVASPIRASDGHHRNSGGRGDGADNLIAAVYPTGVSRGLHHDSRTSPSVKVGTGIGLPAPPAIASGAGVRRLTPLECERLQGFPDGWTEFTADGKPIPDSHRYRLLGNAVATVCAQWIGHRLVRVDEMSR